MFIHSGQMPKKTSADPLQAFRANLSKELEALDQDMKCASEKAGLGQTFVRDVIKRHRDPQLSYVARLAQRHGLSIDKMLELPVRAQNGNFVIRVVGEVAAGRWQHIEDGVDFEQEESPFPPDPRFPATAQFDLIVRGTSINRFARDGERLRCLDIHKAAADIYDDDLVIVRRRKDGGHLVEFTAKRFRRRGHLVELWPDSDDPRWRDPLVIDIRQPPEEEEAEVVALVLYSYNPARSRRRD